MIKSKFSCCVAYKINEETWYIPRGDRVVQDVEWIDPTLPEELIVRAQMLPDINIKHKRQH